MIIAVKELNILYLIIELNVRTRANAGRFL